MGFGSCHGPGGWKWCNLHPLISRLSTGAAPWSRPLAGQAVQHSVEPWQLLPKKVYADLVFA